MVPVVESVKLLLGFGFSLCTDLELKSVRKVGLGRDVSKEVGDIGESGVLWAEAASQFHGGFVLDSFRHVGSDCGRRLVSIDTRQLKTGWKWVPRRVEDRSKSALQTHSCSHKGSGSSSNRGSVQCVSASWSMLKLNVSYSPVNELWEFCSYQ